MFSAPNFAIQYPVLKLCCDMSLARPLVVGQLMGGGGIQLHRILSFGQKFCALSVSRFTTKLHNQDAGTHQIKNQTNDAHINNKPSATLSHAFAVYFYCLAAACESLGKMYDVCKFFDVYKLFPHISWPYVVSLLRQLWLSYCLSMLIATVLYPEHAMFAIPAPAVCQSPRV